MPAARAGAARRERERRSRREPPPKKQRRRSDLVSRILVAIPLAIATIIFIGLGGLAFQLFIIAAGLICMHECYRLLGAWRPVQLIGFAALAAMVFAARSGGQGGVLEVAVAAVPVTLLLVLIREQPRPTVAIGGTLLGIYWIGFAFGHAELLRELPHGNSVLIDVLVGTFVGDTAAYFGREAVRPPSARADRVSRQDRRGAGLRHARRRSGDVHRRPLPDLADPGRRAPARRGGRGAGAAGRHVRVGSSSATPAPRTPGACSAPTAAHSTGWTRRCSRSWSAITSGWRSASTEPAGGGAAAERPRGAS